MGIQWFQLNPWLNYAQRDYRTMKQAIISNIANPTTGIPEITDMSESNPFIKRVSIWCGIGEMLGYYIDNKGREAFIQSCRQLRSAVLLAKQYDYRVRGCFAASGVITFSLDVPLPSGTYIIPIGTVVKTSAGMLFQTTTAATFYTGDQTATANISQIEHIANAVVGVSNGTANQVIVLTPDVVDNSVLVIVSTSTAFTPVDTFTFSTSADNHCKQEQNEDGNYQVSFGDGLNGAIPITGNNISFEYYKTRGAAGNIGVGLITKFVTNPTPPSGVSTISVNNLTPTVGGADAEGLIQLKKNLPLSLRTLWRCVSEQDYKDITEMAPGVAQAGIYFACGKTVDVYIAPTGGGIASPTLISNVAAWLDPRRMITTLINVFSAGNVIIELTIQIKAQPNYHNSVVQTNVIANLTDFFSVNNQQIKGAVYIGDLYQVVENTDGVSNSQVLMMRPMPYAQPLLPSYPALTWTRQQTGSSIAALWRITFVTSTTFKIMENSNYVGTYTTGVLVSLPEISFTIAAGGHTAGDAYQFNTYPVQNDIVLAEQSLPVFDISFANIVVTGGLV